MKNKSSATAEAGQIVEDAQELVDATSHIVEENVAAARNRLAAALQNGKEMLADLKDKAVAGAKATDESIREHPYQAIGIAIGVGALVGFLLGRRR
jgi:ElaB/YqjD/DUF883 family membrane-anchored ribosome-binding protein